MSKDSDPLIWLIRIINIFAGMILIASSIVLLAQIGMEVEILLIIISVTLILIGIILLLNGSFNKRLNNYIRISRLIVGCAMLVLSIVSLIIRADESLAVILLTIAILLNGIRRILDGSFEEYYLQWFRIFSSIIGIITIIMCAFVLIASSLELYILIILLAVMFMLNGIGRIGNAISTYERRKRKPS